MSLYIRRCSSIFVVQSRNFVEYLPYSNHVLYNQRFRPSRFCRSMLKSYYVSQSKIENLYLIFDLPLRKHILFSDEEVPPTAFLFSSDVRPFFGAENRRWRGSSTFGPEDRKLKMGDVSIFGFEDRWWGGLRSSASKNEKRRGRLFEEPIFFEELPPFFEQSLLLRRVFFEEPHTSFFLRFSGLKTKNPHLRSSESKIGSKIAVGSAMITRRDPTWHKLSRHGMIYQYNYSARHDITCRGIT